MSEPVSTSAVLKMGVGTVSAGLLYASAVVADNSLPSPSLHGAMEVLMASLLAWVVREMKSGKRAPAGDGPSDGGGNAPSWRESMLRLAEEAALGTKDIGEKLSLHREEFTEFRGETRSRLNNLEKSVKSRNQHDSGEIRRPSGGSNNE